mmetsp:Transcript_13422/g.14005  ORF Transcript_13422/g.14005 Transcript_13422/m.14005 type:complete len:241 (+) Transcript_13422:3-725(+)
MLYLFYLMILWLFEFGYMLQHVAVIFQVLNISKKRSTEGVSLETGYFFILGSACRLFWMWDSMLASFYFAYLEILLGVASLSYLVYIYNLYKANDYIQAEIQVPEYLKVRFLLVIIVVLSFLFHPGNKNAYYLSLQMFVSLNIFSECIGLLPQLYLIKNTKETGNLSEYYILFLTLARFFRLIFWFKMYIDGNNFSSLILADLTHTILLSVFIYTFKKNANSFAMPTFSEDMNQSRKKIF